MYSCSSRVIGKLQRTLLSLSGGPEALQALGFVLDDASGVYIRPMEAPAAALSAARDAIEAAQARPRRATSASEGNDRTDEAGGATAEADAAESPAADDTYPMTAAELIGRWKSAEVAGKKVVPFYSDKEAAGPLRVFSNFSEHAPWQYTIPRCCGRDELARSGRTTTVALAFAEKGIMLCKASAMGDLAMFDAILRAPSPQAAKKLGRGVRPWDQARRPARRSASRSAARVAASQPTRHPPARPPPQERWDRVV